LLFSNSTNLYGYHEAALMGLYDVFAASGAAAGKKTGDADTGAAGGGHALLRDAGARNQLWAAMKTKMVLREVMSSVPDFGVEKAGEEPGGALHFGEPMARKGGGLINVKGSGHVRREPTLPATQEERSSDGSSGSSGSGGDVSPPGAM
jgi:hypothetical protein